MAAAKKTEGTPETANKYPVYLASGQVGDSELYVGTPDGNFLVKSDTRVDVPFSVKEGLELMEMQQKSFQRYISKKKVE